MPKRNAARSVSQEANVAARMQRERLRHGWSYEMLAARMSDTGCPIPATALFKIENGVPRRRITVDEFFALAKVLDLEPDELLMPIEAVHRADLRVAIEAFTAAAKACKHPLRDLRDAHRALHRLDPVAAEEALPLVAPLLPEGVGLPELGGLSRGQDIDT